MYLKVLFSKKVCKVRKNGEVMSSRDKEFGNQTTDNQQLIKKVVFDGEVGKQKCLPLSLKRDSSFPFFQNATSLKGGKSLSRILLAAARLHRVVSRKQETKQKFSTNTFSFFVN